MECSQAETGKSRIRGVSRNLQWLYGRRRRLEAGWGVMKTKHLLIPGLAASLILSASAKEDPGAEPAEKVQIAILLDTSNSMDGLIDQAKSQLWKVVNTFTEARRDGKTPYVEVALYEYGNSGISVANQYVRLVEPLGRDLDEISRELFALKTNGGEEYCGAVIQRALSDLNWDTASTTYKALFIAGNEPFTQGTVDVREACRDAKAKGVIVNTIHCGPRDEGIAGSWHDGPALAKGDFLIIDQDKAVAKIPAPQDKEISALGIDLNKTYLGYGKQWRQASMKQQEADEDANGKAAAGADVDRAICKASANYDNRSWDIVDAVRERTIDLAKLSAAELPQEMRGLAPENRAAFVEKAAAKRAEIQQRIAGLSREREDFIEKERAKLARKGEKTLDEAIIETTRKQAVALGYAFGN